MSLPWFVKTDTCLQTTFKKVTGRSDLTRTTGNMLVYPWMGVIMLPMYLSLAFVMQFLHLPNLYAQLLDILDLVASTL